MVKPPMPPPDQAELLGQILAGGDRRGVFLTSILNLYADDSIADQPYLPWDEIRHRQPPQG